MKQDDPNRDKLSEQVALFRYRVIADCIERPPGSPGLYATLQEKAQREYDIPGTLRRRVALETMRGWLRLYRTGGFEALRPRPRNDQGRSRKVPQAIADEIVALKEDKPYLSVNAIITEICASGETTLAPSTVARILRRHGLMEKRPKSHDPKDRRRFSYEHAGELFMSDVMHGPCVPDGSRRRRKTYLIAFIDDATRVVPYAAFAFSEGVSAFLPVFRQAVMRRGIPKRLFVDNGAAYRASHLDLVCAKLGVVLIHARPRDAAAKGKQERWFRTVRMQLLPTLDSKELSSLDSLNRRLWSYVEAEYHHAPHRGLGGETPLDRWAQACEHVRIPGPDVDLDDLFLFEARRKVRKDRTVSLNGYVYEVDALLVGETVVLRYDPERLGRTILVKHKDHEQAAEVVDMVGNARCKRNRVPDSEKGAAGLTFRGRATGGA